MMKFAALLMLVSTVSFAQSVKFSFSEEAQSFSSPVQNGETVKIDYIVKALPLTTLDDSFLEFINEEECVYWSSQGTSPDDPGTCGEYRQTGKYLLMTKNNSFPAYSVTEVITDLKSGKKKTRKLEDVSVKLYLKGGTKKLSEKVVPADLKLEAQLSNSVKFGCAIQNTFRASPVLDVPVNLGVCSSIQGSATASKTDGVYSLTVSKSLKLDIAIYGFWMVKDFPRQNYVRKEIWDGAASTSLALEIK